MHDNKAHRLAQLQQWLNGIDGFAGADLTPASSDASFRRYFRATTADSSYIVMDAPPDAEDCERFLRIGGWLRQLSLHSPEILHTDVEQGFLLLEDLGSQQYLDALIGNPARSSSLYADAMAALLSLQQDGRQFQSELPAYDEALLRFELSIFTEWLCERHLRIRFDSQQERQWQQVCDTLVESALKQPRVFVHRDFHSRNLMLTVENNPGILDFQDALEGPLTYDLVSLLKDCYLSWPREQVRKWALDFYGQLSTEVSHLLDADEFMASFDLMGAQRHLKAAGIFARLQQRDGKPDYIRDIPRTLNYVVALSAHYPELEFVTSLVAERVLPALQDVGP